MVLPVFTIKATYKFFPCTPTEELGIRNYLGISPKNFLIFSFNSFATLFYYSRICETDFRERTFLLLLTREHPRKDTSWIGLKVLDILLCLGKLRFINLKNFLPILFSNIFKMANWTILFCVGVFGSFCFAFCLRCPHGILHFRWNNCPLRIFCIAFWIYQIPRLMTNFRIILSNGPC